MEEATSKAAKVRSEEVSCRQFAIGADILTGEPLSDPNISKDPKSIAHGKAGGLVDGKDRAKKLSSKKRSAIAKRLLKAAWTSSHITITI
jgi:hypothetical protein